MTTDNTNDIIIYQSPDGTTSLDVRLDHETVWLTQKQMAELFDKDSDTIGLHISNVYKEGELQPDGTTEDSSVVQNEGTRKVRRKIRFYNLDVIISVGYRVKSRQGYLGPGLQNCKKGLNAALQARHMHNPTL